MSEDPRMARAMRLVGGVSVTQDFEVVPIGSRWTPERVPIVINNFNRLTYLQRLIDSLRSRGYENLYVIDNDSTYGPLLQYYRDERLRVFYLDHNVGYLALWTTPVGASFVSDYYVYTDPDIEPVAECPSDFVAHFREGLDRYRRVDKVGFGLKIDDLPDSYSLKVGVIEHEAQFATRGDRQGFHRASIDTTFALYRPHASGGSWLPSLRTGAPYVARHLPWYEDTESPTEEEAFYLRTIKTSTGWSFRGGDAGAAVLEVPIHGQTVRVVSGGSDLHWNMVSRGEWKPEAYDVLDHFLRATSSYVEIGAGPGQTAFYAGRIARDVYALEPDPERHEELAENARLNADGLANVTVVGLRMPGAPTPAGFVTFDEFVRAHHLSDCDLISVDVDGEHLILPTMLSHLKRDRPTVLVTLRPGRRFGITTRTFLGRATIAVLGLLTAGGLLWTLRFYDHFYDAWGEPLTLWRLLRSIRSRVSIVATDREWPAP